MASWMQEYWYIALIALLVAALILWRVFAGKANAPASIVNPREPAAPLQPVKPEILAAQPAQFAAVQPEAAPASPPPAAAALTIAAAVGTPDNLLLLKGVGPKLNTLLAGLGVLRFDQIAGWTEADMAAVDAHLGAFAGRPARDNWIDQAGYLARGDKAGFEAKYGALGGEL